MGPCESKCPLSYFDMVPCPDSDSARRWRERCRWDREIVALRTSLNKKIRKNEITHFDAKANYQEAVRAWQQKLTLQEVDYQKERDTQREAGKAAVAAKAEPATV